MRVSGTAAAIAAVGIMVMLCSWVGPAAGLAAEPAEATPAVASAHGFAMAAAPDTADPTAPDPSDDTGELPPSDDPDGEDATPAPVPDPPTPVTRGQLKASWQFAKSMTPRQRRLFRAAFRGLPRPGAKIVRQLDGFTLVQAYRTNNGMSEAGQLSEGSFYITINPGAFSDPRTLRFLVLHEFAHVVDIGQNLGGAGRPALSREFRRSPRWKRCFRDPFLPGPDSAPYCASYREIFADQFAYWATGATGDEGCYSPRLINRKAFGRLMGRWYTLWSSTPSPGDTADIWPI